LPPPRRRTIKRKEVRLRARRSASRQRVQRPRASPRRVTDVTDVTEWPGSRRRSPTAHERRPDPGPGPQPRRPARTAVRAPQHRAPQHRVLQHRVLQRQALQDQAFQRQAPRYRVPRHQVHRHRVPLRRASHRTGRRAPSAVPRIRPARSRPTRPPGMARPPTARRAGCRRCRRRPRPGPARASSVRVSSVRVSSARVSSVRVSSGLRARPASQARRGPRSPRRTSGDRGPASRVPRRPGLPVQAASVRAATAPRGRRDPGPARHARGKGLREATELRGPKGPGRVLPGPAARAPVPRGPARGRVTTRSVRPRPAWDRRLRPDPRPRGPASLVVPARVVLVALLARVPAGEVPRARAEAEPRRAGRVPAGSRARAPAAPGPAR
jgi:hypothetical protein